MVRDDHFDLLSRAGYTVAPLRPRLVRIEVGDQSTIARVVPLQQPPTPATIDREIKRAESLGADVPLFLIPRINDTVRRAGLQGDLAAVGATDRIVIVNGDLVELSYDQPELRTTMRRRPWGRLAVARNVIRNRGTLSSQVAVSQATGISQPGVGKAYATLRDEGLLPSDSSRQLTHNQLKELIDYAIDQYPAPGGISTYWYSSKSPAAVALELTDELAQANALIGGDLAADEFAAWKQPRTLAIYSPSGLDLAKHALAESSPATANVILRVPEDATIWRTASDWTDQQHPRFTDPVITAWELSQSADVDSGQAVDRVKQLLLEQAGLL